MSGTTTPNLGLFNTNMLTDGDDFFDFDRDLNGNNNIIDAAIGKLSTLTTTDKTNLVAAINELITKLDGKTSVDLDNLSSLGQAIMDKKVEVEALLQQNGYAKFSWKENNQISILLSWGYQASSGGATVNFPQTYENNVAVFCQRLNLLFEHTPTITSYDLTKFSYAIKGYSQNNSQCEIFWFALGY